MLGRTARCLESAGRRFLRRSNGVIRDRRSSSRSLRRYVGASALRQIANQCAPYFQSFSTGSAATPKPEITALSLLYPQQTRGYFASHLLHPLKRPVPQRKNNTPGYPRSFPRSFSPVVPSPLLYGATGDYPDVDTRDLNMETQAKNELNSMLLQSTKIDNDDAWELYRAAGYPLDLNSALLTHLCRSKRASDHNRSKPLFSSIPAESRSTEDFLHMLMSYANMNDLQGMKAVFLEARANCTADPTWAFTFARLLDGEHLSEAQEVWELRPEALAGQYAGLVISQLDAMLLPKATIAFTSLLTNRKDDYNARQFAIALIDATLSALEVVENTSVEVLLLILRKYKDLGVVGCEHYYTLIETLASSEIRSTFVKTIVIYRNFRWQMGREIPPAKVLRLILHGLVKFDAVNGIRYIMDEIAHLYGKPSKGDYRRALSTLARTGDVDQVNEMFGMLIKDHGKPRIFSLLAPLLYVHATVGNVHDTRIQFERVSKEFGMVPNTVCWNIMLTAYLNNDDLDGVISTFDEMLEKGAKPDSYTFGILMGMCANRGDIDSVLRLLILLKESQIQITSALLDPIVEAYCNNQLLDMAEQVAEACLALDVKGSLVRMWNILLWNHAFRVDLEAISRIRSRMETAGIQPDGMSYSALMLSLVLIGRTDSARRILRTLHRSHRIRATEFHYAIILLGYLKSRNRDMVHVVFREIKERFDRPGFSSRLLVLRSQLQRDLQDIKDKGRPAEEARSRLEHAEKFLTETVSQSSITMLATRHPSPGIGRQSLRQTFPSMYYEYVIAAYGTLGAADRVRELFDEFTSTQLRLTKHNDPSKLPPLRLLAALMFAHLSASEFDKVEECWMTAFPLAVKMARRPDLNSLISARYPHSGIHKGDPPPLPDASRGGTSLLVPSGLGKKIGGPGILPSFRFLLSRTLSLYMRSLAYRGETSRIAAAVTQVQDAGFALSTFNWSTYVQLLSSSREVSDQIKAFVIFEEKFMPRFPGWKHLRRSRGVKPPWAPEDSNVMDRYNSPPHLIGKEGRRIYKKLHPDFLQPTYIAMVSLASSLQGFTERGVAFGNTEVHELYKLAPKTIDAIGDMPYLRDKWQGVLLRGRQVIGDEPGEPLEPFVWTGGVLGVGGKTNITREEEMDGLDVEDGILHVSDADIDTASTGSKDSIPHDTPVAAPMKIRDPEDEHDTELETQLEAQRRSSDITDDQLDTEEPWISDDQYSDTEVDPLSDSSVTEPDTLRQEHAQDETDDEAY